MYMRSCEQYAKEMKEQLKSKISQSKWKPILAIVQIGDNPASNSYVKGKLKDCEEVGINTFHYTKASDVSEEDVLGLIEHLNASGFVDGIIVQLPLPDHINADKVTEAIAKEKDVDGFRKDSPFNPCTPKGIIDWLVYNDYQFEYRHFCVVGRSNIVGRPLVNMLIDLGATVTCCNSTTLPLSYHTQNADVVISAIGRPKFFGSNDFSTYNDVVIDVGINRDEDGKLCGDVDRERVNIIHPDIYVTPVPKGVGLLTRVALLQNVYDAYMMG